MANGSTPGAITPDDAIINSDILNPTATVIGMSAEIGQLVAAVCKVMGEVGGIDKTQASGLNYKFLSEESITTRLRGLMATAGLMVVPRTCRVIEREDYRTKNGAEMTRFLTRQTFMLAHTSGQWVEGETFGESSDSGDKCLNKAMTAAFKYFMRESFLISGGDDPDFKGGDDVARSRAYGADPRGQRPQGNSGGGQRQGAPQGQQGGNQGAGSGNGQGQQSQADPQAAGQRQVDKALEQRVVACVGKIRAATEHPAVDTLVRQAGTVQFTDAQHNTIRLAAAEKKAAFWREAAQAAVTLEDLDAIQTQVAGYLQPWPTLDNSVRAVCQQKAEAIVSAQDAPVDALLWAPVDGDPFADTPVTNVDF